MENRKLISMCAYIDRLEKRIGLTSLSAQAEVARQNWFMSRDYKDFLKQELNIGMFVPAVKVGDKWEVLVDPRTEDDIIIDKIGNCRLLKKGEIEYQAAKQNVVFEGGLINGNELWMDAQKIATNAFGEWVFKGDLIEDLTGQTLTETQFNKLFK